MNCYNVYYRKLISQRYSMVEADLCSGQLATVARGVHGRTDHGGPQRTPSVQQGITSVKSICHVICLA